MKLTQPHIIEKKEKELIESILAVIDWNIIKPLITEKHLNRSENHLIFKNGDMVVHDNRIVYQLDYDIQVPLAVVFSREGECLDIIPDPENLSDRGKDSQHNPDIREHNTEKMEKLAASIADILNEINRNESSR